MKKKHVLNAMSLTMINIAAIGSVKNWPLIAEYGLSSVSYLVLAALIFFIPVSLVTAELATTWPRQGGIYAWITQAFGHKVAFLAMWLFWLLNLIWYPTTLAFVAVSLAYMFNPDLASMKLFTIPVIIVSFWIATFVNLKGMKKSSWVSSAGALCGTFIPGIFIIVLGIIWWIGGRPSDISFAPKNLIPPLGSISQMVFFVGVLLSFCGIEMSAIHARDVERPPKHHYLRSIAATAFILTVPSILGVLAIATVVPQGKLSLVAGSLEAFSELLKAYNISFLLPVIAFLMVAGAFGSIASWLIAAGKGLVTSAETEGDLPPFLCAMNKHDSPKALLITQAWAVSALSLLFVFTDTLSKAFWILSALVTQLYLIVYVILLFAAIKLRYSYPTTERPYRVPGGNTGMWIICMIGVLSSLFAIGIGLVPPAEFKSAHPAEYASWMILCILVSCLFPSFIRLFQKPSWKKQIEAQKTKKQ